MAEPARLTSARCGCTISFSNITSSTYPGVTQSLQREVKRDKVATIFASTDVEATAYLRNKLSMYPPSSPSFALFRNGEPVSMMQRYEIENREVPEIAASLKQAYLEYSTVESTA